MADHLHEQVWIQLLCLPMLNEQQIYLFGQIQNQSNRRSGVQEYFPLCEYSLNLVALIMTIVSVTRCGEISPLGQHFTRLWLLFEDLFSIG